MQFVARMDVGNVHFEDWAFENLHRVVHRNRGEQVRRRIDEIRVPYSPPRK